MARSAAAWARKNVRQGSLRDFGGGNRRDRKILRMVAAPDAVAETAQLTWIRITPRLRFSWVSRTISSIGSGANGDRLGGLSWIHFRAASRRCCSAFDSRRASAASTARPVHPSRGSGLALRRLPPRGVVRTRRPSTPANEPAAPATTTSSGGTGYQTDDYN
jgi:hypothetical protein